MKVLFLCVFMAFSPGSLGAQEPTMLQKFERFELYNACRPMRLHVFSDDEAKKLGLTQERLRLPAERRLRSARIYQEEDAVGASLWIKVNVVGSAFSVDVNFNKGVLDLASGVTRGADTWSSGSFGTFRHNNTGFVVQSLSETLDKFLVEYLRVNEEDCRQQ